MQESTAVASLLLPKEEEERKPEPKKKKKKNPSQKAKDNNWIFKNWQRIWIGISPKKAKRNAISTWNANKHIKCH